MEQFAEDIRRHLVGLPVIAHTDTLGYRSIKFIKRHKAVAVATALVLLSLLAGIVGVSWQARIAALERDKAQIETQKAEQTLAEAIQLWKKSLPEDHPYVANSLFWMGKILNAKGESTRAEPFLRQSLRIRKKVLPESHSSLAKAEKVALEYGC